MLTVKQMGKMKKRPATPEIGTTRLRAFGTSLDGSVTSSAIDVIMPIAAKVYAAGSRPMKKVKSPQPEKLLS